MTKISIAIVDDELENLELLERALGRQYDVSAFSTAASAAEAMLDKTFAMLITDVMMPGMSGVSLARHAKQADPSLIVMVVSGFTEMSEVLAAHSEGVFDIMVAKPWQPEEIQESVTRGLLVRDLQRVGR